MRLSRKIAVVSVLLAGLLGVLVYFYFGPVQLPTPDPLPTPNGYNDFTAAHELLVQAPNWPALPGEQDFDIEFGRRYFASNAPAIARLREGLSRACAVPVSFTNDWLSAHLHDLSGMKVLARNLALGAALEKSDGQTTNALAYDLDILRLAGAINHGGLLIDNLVASANENIAFSELEKLELHLNAAQCRLAITEIEMWRSKREPFATTLEHEKRWGAAYARLEHNPVQVLMARVAGMIASKSLNPLRAAFTRAESKQKQVFGRAAALEMVFARHAYKSEHGSAATKWSDVVPEYLPAIPIDPHTKQPLTHQF
jgi:hypothetical protein